MICVVETAETLDLDMALAEWRAFELVHLRPGMMQVSDEAVGGDLVPRIVISRDGQRRAVGENCERHQNLDQPAILMEHSRRGA